MANTNNLDLETLNILLDTESAYNQILEIINKTNNNVSKIDNVISITTEQPAYGWWFKELS